jgi:hypothetical protein
MSWNSTALPQPGGLDTKRGELQMAPGGHQLALETDRGAGPQHAAVQLDPAVRLVGHHLAHFLPDHVGNAGVNRVSGVGFDVDVVAQRAVWTVDELDDAKSLVHGIEQGPIARLAVAEDLLPQHPRGDVMTDAEHGLCVTVGAAQRRQ